jgi:hypothetical protein
MAKKKPSRQRLWTKDEVRELRALAKQRLTAAIIARRLKRSLDSTKRKASVLGVPLGAAVRWTKDDLQKLRSLAAKKQPTSYYRQSLEKNAGCHRKDGVECRYFAGYAGLGRPGNADPAAGCAQARRGQMGCCTER